MLPNEPHGAGGILVMTSNQQSPAQEHSSCELVHHHFQALFGLRPPPGSCAPPRVPPSPPTAAEKKRWLQNHSADHDSGTPMSQSHQKTSKHRSSPGQSSLSASADKDRDPQYPYPEGPGHPDASQEELKIMYNMLRDKHMRRFCMDFTAAMSVPINQFCLTVVQDIFLALLECKEYEGLHPEEQKSEAFSDDEINDEVEQIQSPTSKTQIRKYCKVQHLPWSSKDLTTIFQWLDQQGEIQSQSNPKGCQGKLPQI
ncbi:hypothetical protein PGT21_000856 [Puccinia graminis f. sp. tritici]|uniref:Uncharacterized protein n=1 Tax=Puccinia graminis f. sp. tritici TaxID=56615 RepID=A0A5B0MGE5_PUCGR|nr:hypothetical protein PGT21_000856 [Puccinia graminis f. sp. tritici]